MATFLAYDPDLKDFATIDPAKAQAMIEDAEAMAVLAAPCLDSDVLTARQLGAVRAILRGAVLRWNETGSGAMQTQAAGPFSATVDTRQERRGMFWPSEIAALRGVCGTVKPKAAFTVDTAPAAVGGYDAYGMWQPVVDGCWF